MKELIGDYEPFVANINWGLNELGLKHVGISVKFHEQPLGAVARIERRLADRR